MADLPKNIRDREFKKFTTNSDGDVCVRVCDLDSLDVLNAILEELGGTPVPSGSDIFDDAQTTTGGASTEVDLFSVNVGSGKTRKLKQVTVSCFHPGKWRLVINDSTTIASGRTGPGYPKDQFLWIVSRELSEGSNIKLKFRQLHGPVTDIEGYLQSTEL